MATAERHTTDYIASVVLNKANQYSFFRLVEYLHRLHDDVLEDEVDKHPGKERIIFSSTGSLGFPASDVIRAGANKPNGRTQYWLETSFLGIHGSASPLPGYFLDIVAHEYAQQEGIRYHFLDFFNHRLITLLHRAWRKYRYYIRFLPKADDGFSAQCYSLIGLYDRSLRSDPTVPWSFLLKYAGLIAGKNRSPTIVASIIGHSFDLKHVEIKEWIYRNVEIPENQWSSLGNANFSLGNDLVCGDRVPTRSGKFTLIINRLRQKRFQDFLPNGKDYKPLIKLINYLLKDQLAYDLDLGLLPEEVPPLQLQADLDPPAYLGWSTFLGQQKLDQSTHVNIMVRQ